MRNGSNAWHRIVGAILLIVTDAMTLIASWRSVVSAAI
jgi:hypothetical protein